MTLIFSNIYKRFLLASVLWFASWPLLYFVKLGDITGAKAWFWIIGELNYPVAAVAYLMIDSIIKSTALRPWMVFTATILIIAIAMPFYYERYGFALGVTLEARIF